MNRIEKLRHLVGYSTTLRRSAVYSGFLGHWNLGDEVLWDAIRDAFADLPMWVPPESRSRYVKALLGCRRHHLAILGGGTLIAHDLPDGTNPFRERFESIRSHARHALVFGTGVGWVDDPLRAPPWLERWQPLLEGCDYIGVRGPHSVRTLASIGVKAEVLGDPACLLAKEAGFWQPRPKTLGVNFGPRHGEIGDAMLRFVTEKIRQGWNVEFFIVCADDLTTVTGAIDRLGLEHPIVHRIYDSAERYFAAVRTMTAFVGVRLHSVILAMCAGVPSVMIDYSPKCLDFMASMDLTEYALVTNELNADFLEARFDDLLTHRDRTASRITRRVVEFRNRQLSMAAQLQDHYLEEAGNDRTRSSRIGVLP